MKPPLSRFTVYGNSMFPALRVGQDIVSVNWFYKVKVGDIVIVKSDGKEVVKRVQNVQGQEVFVQGNNKEESTDSRHFGSVTMDQVIGKVVYQSKYPSNLS